MPWRRISSPRCSSRCGRSPSWALAVHAAGLAFRTLLCVLKGLSVLPSQEPRREPSPLPWATRRCCFRCCGTSYGRGTSRSNCAHTIHRRPVIYSALPFSAATAKPISPNTTRANKTLANIFSLSFVSVATFEPTRPSCLIFAGCILGNSFVPSRKMEALLSSPLIESVNFHLIQISAETTPENNVSARDGFLLRIRAVWSAHSDTRAGDRRNRFSS